MTMSDKPPIILNATRYAVGDGRKRGPYARPIMERFWEKVQVNPGACWLWTGSKDPGYGYGRFGVGYRKERTLKTVLAHRYLYEAMVGKVPDGLELDHLCRNPSCVNPSHLQPISKSENSLRGDNRNRRKTHCPRGHPYDVRIFGRACSICINTSRRASRERKRNIKKSSDVQNRGESLGNDGAGES